MEKYPLTSLFYVGSLETIAYADTKQMWVEIQIVFSVNQFSVIKA